MTRYATYAPVVCPECGRVVELIRDGTFRRHFPPGGKKLCSGTHRLAVEKATSRR